MATPDVLQRNLDFLISSSLFNTPSGKNVTPRGSEIEKKIEFLEGLSGKVSNRKSRRWLNDRMLMELVPRLDAEEIKGLFAPPPWGDDVPLSAFCMTSGDDWDRFRNIDMDKEATIIRGTGSSSPKHKTKMDADKVSVLTAWQRIDCRTREALRRSFLCDLLYGYEESVRQFIQESSVDDVLTLNVQDTFHRLLLHGVCEFHNLTSVTVDQTKGSEVLKMTTIRKKKSSSAHLPNITLSNFLKMTKEGAWQ
ncbi:hypothetical protein LIER_16678 [Lithospermum erythrorhizon]|uniref:R3H-associated N-terminal domain-containing protein n=1 Tax=Lithospermum erythrorhizon TaxID=34254 RepID=A0AAV3Q9G9_LITER